MKSKLRSFLKDDKARIPFSVIGVFLILGSSFTAVYVSKLEADRSLQITQNMDLNKVENLINRAEADLANALNIAALKALKTLGEKPVITPANTDKHDYGDSAVEINMNRVKTIIQKEMNNYLKTCFSNDVFNNGDYAINVVSSGETNPIGSRDEIDVELIKMQLNRLFTVEIMGPDKKRSHPVYCIADLLVPVEIKKIGGENSKVVDTRELYIETIVTSRYNLLENLVEEYQDEIDGTPCSLWTVTTALSNIYSLARGYQHYSEYDPGNVVDNEHLESIVNGGLLLQQGFVFGSVDPWALADFTVTTASKVGGDESKAAEIEKVVDKIEENIEKGEDYYTITSEQFSSVASSPDEDKPHLYRNPKIDISEIAESILYDTVSVKLFFEKNNREINEILESPSERDIQNVVEDKRKKGYQHVDTKKLEMVDNEDTVQKIEEILSSVYTADFKTVVDREKDNVELGGHEGYPINNGSSNWRFKSHRLIETQRKPAKGNIAPGSVMYSEKYLLKYGRDHFWSNKSVDENGNVTWVEYTCRDSKTEYVSIDMILKSYSEIDGTKNDIMDVFYKKTFFGLDLNLMDTVDRYKTICFKSENIRKWVRNGEGEVFSKKIVGEHSFLDKKIWYELEELLTEVKKIKQDESINSANYPDPIALMNAAKTDLLDKLQSRKEDLLKKDEYFQFGFFLSAGAKSVYQAKKWYIEKIEEDIEKYFSRCNNKIEDEIDNALNNYNIDSGDVKQALDDNVVNNFKKELSIPLGYDMSIKGEWNEEIKILVNQKPNYLDPSAEITVSEEENKIEDETFYPLKIKNTCVLGPSGIPLLPPTPATPWVVTFNLWVIEVKGEYKEFRVEDTSNEPHFSPREGHMPQVYVRRHEAIKNIAGETIGENTRINFDYTTVAVSVVPAWGCMVGDTEGGIEEKTEGMS
ncbi:MAG: hypothetical protein V5A64_00700 [Candidatus Thermoplasmatota archaeon]